MGIFMQKIWDNYKKQIQFTAMSVLLFLTFKYLLGYIGPFVVAYFLYTMVKPVTHVLKKKLHLSAPVTGAVILFALIVLAVAAGAWIMMGLAKKLAFSCQVILQNFNLCKNKLCDCCLVLEELFGLKKYVLWNLAQQQIVTARTSWAKQLAPKLVSSSVLCIRPLFAIGTFLLVTYVATILLLKQPLKGNERWSSLLQRTVAECIKYCKMFLRAQVCIMAVIFVICLTAFCVTGLSSPALWGLITAFLDVLPFIGTGIVLVPLSIWYVLMGEYLYAVVMLTTYVICIFSREFLEPKLISGSLGISPILTLIGIYIGVKTLGLVGVFLGPVYVLLLTVGYRHFFSDIL